MTRAPWRFHFDLAQGAVGIGCVLLMTGVIHFTPVAVGALVIGSMCSLRFTWEAR